MQKFDFSKVEEFLEDFLNKSKKKEWTSAEIFDHLVAKNGGTLPPDKNQLDQSILEYFKTQNLYFVIPGEKGGLSLFRARKSFFAGSQFLIRPSSEELKEGILLFGARFVPFASEEVFCDEYILTSAKNKKEKKKIISISFSEIAKSYMLLGRSEAIDTLVAEDDANYQAIRNASKLERARVNVTVADLKEFYAKNEFRQGDSILVTVKDWEKGAFHLEKAPGNEDPKEVTKFLDALENGLKEAYTLFGDYQPMAEQLAYSWNFAAKEGFDLRKNPVFALDDYPSMMVEITINREEAEWYFMPLEENPSEITPLFREEEKKEPHTDTSCSCGHSHGHTHPHKEGEECSCHSHGENEEDHGIPHLPPEGFSASSGKMDSLESILEDIKSPVTPLELFAMIQDELSNGGDNFEVFYGRSNDQFAFQFSDDAQEAAFLNFLEEAWEDAVEHFHMAHEETKRPLRSRLLALTSRQREESEMLLAKYKNALSDKIKLRAGRLHENTLATLGVILGDMELTEDENYEQLELRVGDLEDAWEEFVEEAANSQDA